MFRNFELIASRRMLVMLLLGFSSGLPLPATGDTIKAWLTLEGVDVTTIGLYSLVGLPYSFKFVWAPLFDRFVPPVLGRRRGWMLLLQLGLAAAMAILGLFHPLTSAPALVACCVLVAFVSASQDIVLDAHRRDVFSERELGLGSSVFVGGYRLGMIAGGAGAIYLSTFASWHVVYLALAASMVVGLVGTYLAPEPEVHHTPPSLKAAVVEPFEHFFARRGAIIFLLFILLYKLGDAVASSMTVTYVLRLGYTRKQYVGLVKLVGTLCSIGGGIAGGLIILRTGLFRALFLFGLLQALSVYSLTILEGRGQDLYALGIIIGLENVSFGMGTAAFVALIGSLCDRRFSATQYALLSSLSGVPRSLAGGAAGKLAEVLGWHGFFLFSTALALPGLLLIGPLKRHLEREKNA